VTSRAPGAGEFWKHARPGRTSKTSGRGSGSLLFYFRQGVLRTPPECHG